MRRAGTRLPGGLLGWVERAGNRLPDPATIFVGLGVLTLLASTLAARAGLSVAHPATGTPVVAGAQGGPDGQQDHVAAVFKRFLHRFRLRLNRFSTSTTHSTSELAPITAASCVGESGIVPNSVCRNGA